MGQLKVFGVGGLESSLFIATGCRDYFAETTQHEYKLRRKKAHILPFKSPW